MAPFTRVPFWYSHFENAPWIGSPFPDQKLPSRQVLPDRAAGQRRRGLDQDGRTLVEGLPPVVPLYRFVFLGEGSPAKIDSRKKKWCQLILTSLLEDLGAGIQLPGGALFPFFGKGSP